MIPKFIWNFHGDLLVILTEEFEEPANFDDFVLKILTIRNEIAACQGSNTRFEHIESYDSYGMKKTKYKITYYRIANSEEICIYEQLRNQSKKNKNGVFR